MKFLVRRNEPHYKNGTLLRIHIRNIVPHVNIKRIIIPFSVLETELNPSKTDNKNGAKPTKPREKRVRADAQRSTDALLEAAKSVFATSGVDAPVREVAEKAGVGIGTVYRNFPQRSDLIAGVFRREVDACVAEAEKLSGAHFPLDALSRWLHRYTLFITTKKGLASALHSGDPAFATLPEYFRKNFEPALTALLERATDAGDINGDVEPYDLLRAIGNLSVASGEDGADHIRRMVDLMIRGLRFGSAGSGGPDARQNDV
ncbi:TetR/AcrR family transcriptional regulator [uncultured Tateyamaria sp.]|uniref:TetR/AcrR family transcriptional regulator n=1 Tax=uncultured Tateyamaria sp. TaxID=455651 RepID=UPI00260F183D|nr:TetR/AcrR family transcriptional regulator [uncultured Tateyamaria sp.]